MGLKYRIDLPLDSPERTLLHGQIIRRKTFTRRLYTDWYLGMKDRTPGLPDGKLLELGSGGGFFKQYLPQLICSDILDLPANDMTFSALEMPFEADEVSGIFMIDTFHHIPDSGRFLQEVDRILNTGGILLMIEPANSWWGRFIYRHFHHEPFDPAGEWKIPESGPLSGANGALPWIVFERDFPKFARKFPRLELEQIRYHTPLRYLLSGGVSFRQLVPGFSYKFFRGLDRLLSGISPGCSMFMTIRIRKR